MGKTVYVTVGGMLLALTGLGVYSRRRYLRRRYGQRINWKSRAKTYTRKRARK